MLMEQLFSSGIMQMGPSRVDPVRQVGVFNPAAIAGLPAARSAGMERILWMVGEWDYENSVPPTRYSPAYSDIGSMRLSWNEKTNWICLLAPDGQETPHLTFDPFSKRWIYLLIKGSYGILRASEWEGNRLAFTGLITMIGIDTEWRLTLVKDSPDRYLLVNEERAEDGSWAYIDEWRFTRKNS
jgi:hypothetical protein